jgi:NitT/TauT family transport system substrate-binding protein
MILFMRRTLSMAALAAITAGPAAATDVKFMMDWAWQGPQAFALVSRDAGCFEEGGVDITLDRGFGSGRVPVELAGGTYDMGLADINPTIKFRAENPDSDIIAVAVIFSGSPLVAVVPADGPIQEPKDFEGKTLAAPDFDAGRQLFPIFAAATGIDDSTIEWISVKPELREPMLVQGQADGITGFVTSTGPSLARLGMAEDAQRAFKYKDYGVELYSSSILTTRDFAEENPEAVAAVVDCMIQGVRMAEADPDAAMQALKAHEPLTDVEVEKGRWMITVNEMLRTEDTLSGGLSAVDMERLQRSIMAVEDAYGVPNALQAADLYTDAFLPPAEERMLMPATN